MSGPAQMLELHRRFYPRRAIAAAAAAFAEVATVRVAQEGDVFRVTVAPKGRGPANLADEFANHVLALVIEDRR
jgi:hypothetical protein